jgi:hypothetical protein
MGFSPILAASFFCSVRPCSGWVAARLLHTEHIQQESNLRPSDSHFPLGTQADTEVIEEDKAALLSRVCALEET